MIMEPGGSKAKEEKVGQTAVTANEDKNEENEA